MQVVLNVKGSFRTAESGHNGEVVALYRWPLGQVPLYSLIMRLSYHQCTTVVIITQSFQSHTFLIFSIELPICKDNECHDIRVHTYVMYVKICLGDLYFFHAV